MFCFLTLSKLLFLCLCCVVSLNFNLYIFYFVYKVKYMICIVETVRESVGVFSVITIFFLLVCLLHF